MNYTNRSLPGETNNKIYVEFKIIIASFLLSLVVLFFVARPIYMEMKIKEMKQKYNLKSVAILLLLFISIGGKAQVQHPAFCV